MERRRALSGGRGVLYIFTSKLLPEPSTGVYTLWAIFVDIFQSIFLEEFNLILFTFYCSFIPVIQTEQTIALAEVMAWRESADSHRRNQWLPSSQTPICDCTVNLILFTFYCSFIPVIQTEQTIALAEVMAWRTVYPKKYAHGFVVLCFVVVMQSFIINSHEVFIYIHQGCFAGTGAVVRLPQCQWSKPGVYGKSVNV